MAKVTVEIDDTLQEIVEGAIEEVKDELLSYLEQNPDTDETPDLGNDLDYSGRIHEIVDGSVPIYYSEIDGLYYLHGNDLDEAYENAGIGDGFEDNHRQVTIYCYIDQAVGDWYHSNAGDVFDEWKAKQTPEADECETCNDPATCEKCHSCAKCCTRFDCETLDEPKAETL